MSRKENTPCAAVAAAAPTGLPFFNKASSRHARMEMIALPAPTNDALAGRAEALEKDVAVLVWKIEFARLLRRVRAEVHVPPVINVEELERVDQRGLAGVVRADDLQRARKIDLGVFVTPGVDEDESLRAGRHRE